MQTELMGIMLGARIVAEHKSATNQNAYLLTASLHYYHEQLYDSIRAGLTVQTNAKVCNAEKKYRTLLDQRTSGNGGNDRADKIANQFARMPFWGPEPAITPSVALSNEIVK